MKTAMLTQARAHAHTHSLVSTKIKHVSIDPLLPVKFNFLEEKNSKKRPTTIVMELLGYID